MPKKGRYAHLKGSSAYYPFGARTKLRRRQRRHVVLLRVVGLALLVPAADYYQEAEEGGQVLLQGVVDCYFETLEGITVVDFKTDRVTKRTVAERAEDYRPQLTAYSRALEEITGKPVARRCLWFFAIDQAVEV